MRSLPFAALLLLLTPLAHAQQGAITYSETVKMEIELPPEMESMRDQIPSSRTVHRLLLFNESETLMKDAPQPEEEEEATSEWHGDGVNIRLDRRMPETITYANLDEGTMVEKRDFLGRVFRIAGEVPEYQWRLTGEQSEYLGYACQKAVAVMDSSTVEAWFSPEIPVSAGPAEFGGLPGMILVVNVDDGRRTITAQNVSMDDALAAEIEAPSGGREVSREEFDEIVEEKMKEMGATRGSGGGMRIMIRN